MTRMKVSGTNRRALQEAGPVSATNFVVPENKAATDDDMGSVIDYVKSYARQEIVTPVQNAPRWIGFGLGGALMFGIGLMFVVLGALRFMQTAFPAEFHRVGWSLLMYSIGIFVCVLVIAFGLKKIKKPTLEKGSTKQ